MKTLSKILWENVLQHLDLGENGAYDEMNDFEAIIRKEYPELKSVSDVIRVSLRKFLIESGV